MAEIEQGRPSRVPQAFAAQPRDGPESRLHSVTAKLAGADRFGLLRRAGEDLLDHTLQTVTETDAAGEDGSLQFGLSEGPAHPQDRMMR